MANILTSVVIRRGLFPVIASREGASLWRSVSTSPLVCHGPDEHKGGCGTTPSPRQQADKKDSDRNLKKATTPVGRLDEKWEGSREKAEPQGTAAETDVYAPFPDGKNPLTGEVGGPRGPEPTRYGDWERKGRVIDF